MTLETISIYPSNGLQSDHLMVMLHGWGANYQDLVQLTEIFELPNYQFLFPNAPFPHFQIPEGKAWYSLENGTYDGIDESRQLLRDFLLSLPEKTGIPLDKTIVTGFSQGGAMSLDVALKLPVAGICCLSGYLQFTPEKQDQAFPPVLICHGKLDSVVPIDLAQKAKQDLELVGVKVEYHELEMSHEITPEEIMIITNFVTKIP